jgi:hypothetical protein
VVALSWVTPAPPGPAPVLPQASGQVLLPLPSPAPAPQRELVVTDAFSFAEVANESEGPSNAFVQLAAELGHCSGKLVLTGHTCSLGPEEANLAIGLQRAAKVRDHLVRAGLDAARIEIRTEGSRSPLAPNDTEEGRRRNRRVTAICNELTTE